MSDDLGAFLSQLLLRVGAGLVESSLALLLLAIAGVLVGWFLIRRLAPGSGVNVNLQWRADGIPPEQASPNATGFTRPPSAPARTRTGDLRRKLDSITHALLIFSSLGLLAGAGIAYWHHTPANMLLLIAGILFLLAIIVFGKAARYERNDESVEEWRGLWDQFRNKVQVTTHSGGTTLGGTEVHHLNQAALDTALRMARTGSTLDDICGAVEPAYATWDAFHQQAYRQILQAALDHART